MQYKWTRYWAPLELSLQSYDFLLNASSLFFDKRLVTFDAIHTIPCLVLLGNPGVGKSRTIAAVVEQLNAASPTAILKNLREYNSFSALESHLSQNANFRSWQLGNHSLHLFLDSLDEGRLIIKRLEHDLLRFLENLPLERLFFRITCRSAEIPGDLLPRLKALWKEDDSSKFVETYQLAQLTRQDVWLAAEQRGLDADAFLEAVELSGAAPFAAYPVTLQMLFNIFENIKALPDTRSEIYADGCRYLIQENSASRRDDDQIGHFEVVERLQAARQLAAMSIIGNRPRIYSGIVPQYDNETLQIQDCYSADGDLKQPEALFRETLQTGLFTGTDYCVWAHLSYGEYLAADFIEKSQMTLPQIQSLLINHDDHQAKIAPKLYETAAWLASMRNDIFLWILQTEPIILLHSQSTWLTAAQKTTLLDHFIEVYGADGIIENRLDWNDYKRLDHSQIGSQLRTYLADKALPSRARKFAMDIVNACDVLTIDDALINLALDVDELPVLRHGALASLSDPKRTGKIYEVLRPLVFQTDAYRVDAVMIADTLRILWPHHLTADELFAHLFLPSIDDPHSSFSYDKLLNDDILDNFTDEDLPEALAWIAKQNTTDSHPTLSGQMFIASIMQRAFSRLDNEIIRVDFAKAVWSRLIQYSPVLSLQDNYPANLVATAVDCASALLNNPSLRHQILEAMLTALSPAQSKDEQMLSIVLFSGQHGFPVVLRDDLPWLLDQIKRDIPEESLYLYAYFIYRLVLIEDVELIALLYEDYGTRRNPIVVERFKYCFEPVLLTSEQARSGRERLAQRRAHEKWEKELNESHPPFPLEQAVQGWLDKSSQDSSNWWILCLTILKDSRGSEHEDIWDICKGDGWQYISKDQAILQTFLSCAVKYIEDQNPYIGDTEPSALIHERRPAMAGYRAIVLFSKFNLLHLMTSQDWQRWSDAIAFNYYASFVQDADFRRLDDSFLRQAFEIAAEHLLDILKGYLDHERAEMYIEGLFRRFKYAPAAELALVVFNYLPKVSPDKDKFHVLLRFLLEGNTSYARDAQEIALRYFRDSLTETSQEQAVRIAQTLAHYSRNNHWWPAVREALIMKQISQDIMLNAIADKHQSQYLRYFTEEELYNLFVLAAETYSFETDIELYGGALPSRYIQQEWRDSILLEISGRGSQIGIDTLENLYREHGPRPTIGYALEQAKARFRVDSWRAPLPSTIIQLAGNRTKRFARNADELLAIIIDVLLEIEKDLHGRASEQRKIWDKQADDTFRPVEEEAFSDAVADWLRTRLPTALVNREAEVRQHTDTPRGDRTDIVIDALNDLNDRMTVIIEVKGCWYRNLYDRIQEQLVDKYLAQHPSCSHGIYLVGYFASTKWDPSDRRLDVCSNRNKEQLNRDLHNRIASLTLSRSIVVKSHIFDGSLD